MGLVDEVIAKNWRILYILLTFRQSVFPSSPSSMDQPPATPTVPEWIDGRLQAIVSAIPAIHFEHSVYGPLAAYLHTLFPPERSFMVKPQGMLRPKLDHNDGPDIDIFSDIGAQEGPSGKWTRDDILGWARGVDDGLEDEDTAELLLFDPDGSAVELDILQNMDDDSDGEPEPDHIPGPDTSLDSYGIGVKRTNKGIRYPDFIVVKATKSLTNDTILLVVEVKKDDDSRAAARLQICKYLEIAAGKRRAKFLQGLLVMGKRSECYRFGGGEEGSIGDAFSFPTTSAELNAITHRIAVDNW
ncbi:hypothetical protein BD779DRAFT_1472108 [Infundibulicybe gibba]|nr:hypothetical protein BD779DRAFT_1472108 [Infundibulicybe gibba]